jgi:hypothetical protein
MTEQGQGVAQPLYPRKSNVHSGGKQEHGGRPPYEGRQESSEREGVSATDTTGASPHGVGVSTSTPGNEQALSDSEATRRSDRIDTDVSREENVDPEAQPCIQGTKAADPLPQPKATCVITVGLPRRHPQPRRRGSGRVSWPRCLTCVG